MPHASHNVLALRFHARRIGRLLQRSHPGPEAVDAETRTFWARDPAPATLVLADPGTSFAGRADRVAAMIAAHEAGDSGDAHRRPRGSPAFAEAVFVELMRSGQYRRAFEQLTADCRQRWATPEAFAAAQGEASMSRLQGVRVLEVRHLPEWKDRERGTTHTDVAELQVEYTVGEQRPPRVIARTVHLVAEAGRWRSLCYPG